LSDAEANKALVRRFFNEAWNGGSVELLAELVASDYAIHSNLDTEVFGPDGLRAAITEQRTAFPDLETTIEDIVAEGDRVAVRAVDRGTFERPFMGMEPTGRRFAITWIDIFRIEDGKLAEAWLELDVAEFQRQLAGSDQPGAI
jgi:steroid delta-isomerase-like uncharacterized protein